MDSNSPIWKIIQFEFNNLNVESIKRKEFSELKLKKYPHIKKGTLAAQISIQVVNKRARTGYAQCNKVRQCGGDKFDFLFENEGKSICRYQQHIHKSYEIYQREEGKLDVRKLEEIKVENVEFWWEGLDDYKRDNKISILEIDEMDLKNNEINNIRVVGMEDIGDWNAFASLTSNREAELNKKDFGDKNLTFLVLLYSSAKYVTCISGE